MPKKPKRSGGRRKRQRTLPGVNAFLICEKIIWDQIANAPTLVSLFSEFGIYSLPTDLQSFWLFLQVADGLVGKYEIEIEVQDLDRGELIHKFPGAPLVFRYRPEVFNAILQVPRLRIDYPSHVYAVVVFADGELLAQQKFTVKVRGSSNEQPND